jgi:hypothetical protein
LEERETATEYQVDAFRAMHSSNRLSFSVSGRGEPSPSRILTGSNTKRITSGRRKQQNKGLGGGRQAPCFVYLNSEALTMT